MNLTQPTYRVMNVPLPPNKRRDFPVQSIHDQQVQSSCLKIDKRQHNASFLKPKAQENSLKKIQKYIRKVNSKSRTQEGKHDILSILSV